IAAPFEVAGDLNAVGNTGDIEPARWQRRGIRRIEGDVAAMLHHPGVSCYIPAAITLVEGCAIIGKAEDVRWRKVEQLAIGAGIHIRNHHAGCPTAGEAVANDALAGTANKFRLVSLCNIEGIK